MPSNNKYYNLGCRANYYQTIALQSQMPPTYIIIGTCLVTHDAERRSKQLIRKALRENPKNKVMVTGCLANLRREELIKEFPGIIVQPSPSFIPLNLKKAPRVRMELMIEDGCENFCSYCIVPFARGKVRTKPIDQVLSEAKDLVSAGAKEIILTGINLGAYGSRDLCSVLCALSSIPSLSRIRLSSIEPMHLTKELIDVMATTPKVCDFLHIPLQSGDNTILKAMWRDYSTQDYHDLITYIRKKMPDAGISTDIIVGFPGEKEEHFQNTLDLVNKIKFSRMHIFPFSKRPGTAAANLPGQINPETIKERCKKLFFLRDKFMREFQAKFSGQPLEILVEQKDEGLTTNFIRIFYSGTNLDIGKFINLQSNQILNIGN